jgi:hypothetical protein
MLAVGTTHAVLVSTSDDADLGTIWKFWTQQLAQVIIGEITKHVGIDRIVAKRLRVPLQTDPAEPTVDVQVQSPGLLSAAVFEKD